MARCSSVLEKGTLCAVFERFLWGSGRPTRVARALRHETSSKRVVSIFFHPAFWVFWLGAGVVLPLLRNSEAKHSQGTWYLLGKPREFGSIRKTLDKKSGVKDDFV